MTTANTPPIQNNLTKRALILGATGNFGASMARALLAHGWQISALQRDPTAARQAQPDLVIEWIAGDAMQADDVARAAQGVSVIVHAVNPPNYQRWRELALPMLDNSIAAARAQNARIVLPGNVYNYGPDAGSYIAEDAPQHPQTQKGQVRVEMEEILQQSGVPTLIMRAGDFFGGGSPSAWFHYMFRAGQPLSSMLYPGDRSIRREWAYLPDMTEATVALLDQPDALTTFERFHYAGYALTGQELIDAVRRVTQQPKLKVRRMPWWLIALAAPFARLARELNEMRYLWQEPLILDGRKLTTVLGSRFVQTPMEDALRASLTELGCLPVPQDSAKLA